VIPDFINFVMALSSQTDRQPLQISPELSSQSDRQPLQNSQDHPTRSVNKKYPVLNFLPERQDTMHTRDVLEKSTLGIWSAVNRALTNFQCECILQEYGYEGSNSLDPQKDDNNVFLGKLLSTARQILGRLLLAIHRILRSINTLRFLKFWGTVDYFYVKDKIEVSDTLAVPLWASKPYIRLLRDKIVSFRTPIHMTMNDKLYWNLVTFRLSVFCAFIPVFIGLLGSFFVNYTLCSSSDSCLAISTRDACLNGITCSIDDFNTPCSSVNSSLIFYPGGCVATSRADPVVHPQNCTLSMAITAMPYIRYPRSRVEVALFSLFLFCCFLINAFEENEKIHSSVALARGQISDPYSCSTERFLGEIRECFHFYKPLTAVSDGHKLLHGAFTRSY
jgi:hypothetical protein